MDEIQIEFTDRYGRNPPSWLRGCFECEAMGCYPVKAHDQLTEAEVKNEKLIILDDNNDHQRALSAHEAAWIQEWIATKGFEADGWYIVKCLACNGSARASWLRTLLRIPRWLLKGIPFMFVHAPRFDPDMPYWSAVWLGFKCAYLVDLKLWRP